VASTAELQAQQQPVAFQNTGRQLRVTLFTFQLLRCVSISGFVNIKCCYVCVQEIDANLKELTFDTFTQLYHNMLFSPSVSSCLLTLLLFRMRFDCFVCLLLVV
jgi:hypothetical protein